MRYDCTRYMQVDHNFTYAVFALMSSIMHTSFKVKGQGHQADIMLRPEVCHTFRTEWPTNLKLGVQMEDEDGDPYSRDGPLPARLKVKICDVTWCV